MYDVILFPEISDPSPRRGKDEASGDDAFWLCGGIGVLDEDGSEPDGLCVLIRGVRVQASVLVLSFELECSSGYHGKPLLEPVAHKLHQDR